MELHWLTIEEASRLIRARELSVVDYVSALLSRIETLDDGIHAFLLVDRAGALEAAQAADTEIAAGHYRGVLHGIPYSLKDNIDRAGFVTTANSRILADAPSADRDAPVTAALDAAGAIFMGKNACHEFAAGGPSFDLPWPAVRNPWDPERHPGSSSTGSGAAVAAGFVPLAIGTDTGGSIRNPASSSGVVGLKPTFGLIDCTGVFPLAPSFDTIGPITRTAADAQLAFDVLRGREASVVPAPRRLDGARIGYVRQFHTFDVTDADPDVSIAMNEAAAMLARLGARVSEVRMPALAEFDRVHHLIMQFEAYAIHRDWLDTRGEEYSAPVRERLLTGTEISDADYESALVRRDELTAEFDILMQGFDALLCVSSMEPAARLADVTTLGRSIRRQARKPFNVLGAPVVALPVGLSREQLPIGAQLVGREGNDDSLLGIARTYEGATEWTRIHPPMPQLTHHQ